MIWKCILMVVGCISLIYGLVIVDRTVVKGDCFGNKSIKVYIVGPLRYSKPGPPALQAGIVPLDQADTSWWKFRNIIETRHIQPIKPSLLPSATQLRPGNLTGIHKLKLQGSFIFLINHHYLPKYIILYYIILSDTCEFAS